MTGVLNLVDDDTGPWLSVTAAAPRLGRTAREVRILCETKQIDHQKIESTSGEKRFKYRISEQAILRFLRRNVVRAAS